MEVNTASNVGAKKPKYKKYTKPVPAMMTAVNLSGTSYKPEKIYKDLNAKYSIVNSVNSFKVVKPPSQQSNTLQAQSTKFLEETQSIDPNIPVGVPVHSATAGQRTYQIRNPINKKAIANLLGVPNRIDSIRRALKREYPIKYGALSDAEIEELLDEEFLLNKPEISIDIIKETIGVERTGGAGSSSDPIDPEQTPQDPQP